MQPLKVKQAKNLWDQTKGLLGTNKAYPLLLTTRWGVHTLGMKYPIDVVVLNQRYEIVKMKENLKPNQMFLWNPFYNQVLELPEGSIKTMNLSLKSKVNLLIQ